MASFLGFCLMVFSQNLMFRQQKIGVVLCLLDKAINCLFGSCIGVRLQCFEMLKNCLFEMALIVNHLHTFLLIPFPLLLHLNADEKPAVLKFISENQIRRL
jgi:hypothetical protein